MILGTSQSDNSGESTFADEAEGSLTVVDAIKQGDYDGAINSLDEIIKTSDSSLGGSAPNDFIKNPNDQKKLIQLVTNVQNALKGQTCIHLVNVNNCFHIPLIIISFFYYILLFQPYHIFYYRVLKKQSCIREDTRNYL